MTLYELTGEFLSLMEMAGDGDVSPDAIINTAEALEMEIEEKADGYAKIIKALEAEADGLKGEIERLEEKKKVVDAKVDRLKRSLESAMLATGKTKFKTLLFSFTIQKNNPSVYLMDEKKVPKRYRIPVPDKVDKKALLAYLKEKGDTEWAFVKQSESLRIR